MNVSGNVGTILAHKKVSSVWSVGPNAMVGDVIVLMDKKNVGALPVLNEGKLVGIVSERDCTRRVILMGKPFKETPVSEIMTANRVRHLPVLEGTKMVGILSIGDVLNWLLSAHTATIDQLESYITGS